MTQIPDKSEPNDPYAEWIGMPRYTNEDKSGVQKVVVHFKTFADVEEFARLVAQKITKKTKFIWFPRDEDEPPSHFKYLPE